MEFQIGMTDNPKNTIYRCGTLFYKNLYKIRFMS